ncbi:hypothetical protein HDU78_003413 [Chytriomyces hyalinus]|nr:hypothetical protein HDU78_003413 [Chytriomyces hyalinus]
MFQRFIFPNNIPEPIPSGSSQAAAVELQLRTQPLGVQPTSPVDSPSGIFSWVHSSRLLLSEHRTYAEVAAALDDPHTKQLVIFGYQSGGKSYLLRLVTGVGLVSCHGIGTRFPTHMSFQRATVRSCTIKRSRFGGASVTEASIAQGEDESLEDYNLRLAECCSDSQRGNALDLSQVVIMEITDPNCKLQGIRILDLPGAQPFATMDVIDRHGQTVPTLSRRQDAVLDFYWSVLAQRGSVAVFVHRLDSATHFHVAQGLMDNMDRIKMSNPGLEVITVLSRYHCGESDLDINPRTQMPQNVFQDLTEDQVIIPPSQYVLALSLTASDQVREAVDVFVGAHCEREGVKWLQSVLDLGSLMEKFSWSGIHQEGTRCSHLLKMVKTDLDETIERIEEERDHWYSTLVGHYQSAHCLDKYALSKVSDAVIESLHSLSSQDMDAFKFLTHQVDVAPTQSPKVHHQFENLLRGFYVRAHSMCPQEQWKLLRTLITKECKRGVIGDSTPKMLGILVTQVVLSNFYHEKFCGNVLQTYQEQLKEWIEQFKQSIFQELEKQAQAPPPMGLVLKEVLDLAERDSTAAAKSALTELEGFVVDQLWEKTTILKDLDSLLYEKKYPRLDSMENQDFRESLSHLTRLCHATPKILEPLLVLQVCDCVIRKQQEQLKMQSEKLSVLSVCHSLVSCLSGGLVDGAIDAAISGLSSLLDGQGGDCLDRFAGLMKRGGANATTVIRNLEPLIPGLIEPSSSADRVELFASMLENSGFQEQPPQQTSDVEVPEPGATAATPAFESDLSSSASSDGDTLPVHTTPPSAHVQTDVDAFLEAIYAENAYTCHLASIVREKYQFMNEDLFTEPYEFAEKLLRDYRGILVRAAAALINEGGIFNRGENDVVVTQSVSGRIHEIAKDLMAQKLEDKKRSRNAVSAALSASPFQ